MRILFRDYPRYSLFVVLTAVTVMRCTQQPPEHLRSATVISAMHDDMLLVHDVAGFMIKDHDGVNQLAEQLAKDPAAAGQLMDAMIRKGGLEKVFAERCGALRPQPKVAPESQEHPLGG